MRNYGDSTKQVKKYYDIESLQPKSQTLNNISAATDLLNETPQALNDLEEADKMLLDEKVPHAP